MSKKVNCLKCTSLLIGLYDGFIEGTNASLGKCVYKKHQIRQPIRNCNLYRKNAYIQHNLDYNRKKLVHINEVLDMIEETMKNE